jgi:hypothetical protein
MKKLGKSGKLKGCPVVEDIMRKETKIRTKAKRNRRYFFANVAFFGLMG